MAKQQLTGPEPATSRSIADSLAAMLWPLRGEWIDAGRDHSSAVKGSAIEVVVSGSVSCCFSFPPLSFPCVVRYLVFHWYHHGM